MPVLFTLLSALFHAPALPRMPLAFALPALRSFVEILLPVVVAEAEV
jgi:hypothetical protein